MFDEEKNPTKFRGKKSGGFEISKKRNSCGQTNAVQSGGGGVDISVGTGGGGEGA